LWVTIKTKAKATAKAKTTAMPRPLFVAETWRACWHVLIAVVNLNGCCGRGHEARV
jgi:hypothetical protein